MFSVESSAKSSVLSVNSDWTVFTLRTGPPILRSFVQIDNEQGIL